MNEMLRIRTIFGLQKKDESTLDGYRTETWRDIRCWVDDEDNLYGATPQNARDHHSTTIVYNNDGSIKVTRTNHDYDDVRERIEQLTGKKVRPVDVSGLFPYVSVKGHNIYHYGSETYDHERAERDGLGKNHWYHDELLRGLGQYRWFNVFPLVIPKKYVRKMKVSEAVSGTMEGTVKPDLVAWSVI